MRLSTLAVLIGGLAIAPSMAQARVAFVGIQSSDMPTAEISAIGAELDAVLFAQSAGSLSREGTLEKLRADAVVADACLKALTTRDAGKKALEALDLDTAEKELRQSGGYYRQCYGEWTSPVEVSDLYLLRAQVAFGKRKKAVASEAMRRVVRSHPTKKLDPAVFAPELVQLFDQAIRSAAEKPPAPPNPQSLAGLAKRVGARHVVVAEVQRGPQSLRMLLTLVKSTGDLTSKRVKLPVLGNRKAVLIEAVDELLHQSGVVGVAAAPTPTPARVPDGALPDPNRPTHSAKPAQQWYRRWYVWAAVGVVVAAGGVTAAAAANDPGPQPTPGPTGGITIIVDGP